MIYANTYQQIVSASFCLRLALYIGAVTTALLPGTTFAMDLITVKEKTQTRTLEGAIEVEAQNGGILLRDRQNALIPLNPEIIVSRSQDDRPFSFLSADEIKETMLAELPKGCAVYQTANYLIFYDTSPAFAQWTGSLFERLHDIFYNFWKNKGVELQKTETPLIAIVLSNKQAYSNYALHELQGAVDSVIGYYSMQTNRMVMYDLTGADAGISGSGYNRGTAAAKIARILSQPDAVRLVSTVAHEATHQLAYNSGLQGRWADMPRWYSEGIAIYFETPDSQSKKGWNSIGKINKNRLKIFRSRFGRRNPEALKKLLTLDSLFNDAQTATDAYAEAWALTHFLIQKYPQQYAQYAELLQQKKPFFWDSSEKRLEDFESVFGPWEKIDKQMMQFFSR